MGIKPGFAAATVLVWASGHPVGALAVRIGLRQVAGLLLGVTAVLTALWDRLGSFGTGAAAMTTLSSVVPSVTALIAWPLLGQVPTSGVVAGLVLGFGACWLGTATHSGSVARTAVEEPAGDG